MTTKKTWTLDEEAASDAAAVAPRGDATPLLVPMSMSMRAAKTDEAPPVPDPAVSPDPGPPLRPSGPVPASDPEGSFYARHPPDEPAPTSDPAGYRQGPSHLHFRDRGPVLMGNPKGSRYTDEPPPRRLRLVAIGVGLVLAGTALTWLVLTLLRR